MHIARRRCCYLNSPKFLVATACLAAAACLHAAVRCRNQFLEEISIEIQCTICFVGGGSDNSTIRHTTRKMENLGIFIYFAELRVC